MCVCLLSVFNDTQYACGLELTLHVRSYSGVAEDELEDAGLHHVVYHRFVGNRFHIYLLCGGLLYHYREVLKDYFTTVQHPANQVQQGVFNALQVKELAPVLRSLGIMGKVLTGPWMRMVAVAKNILDLKAPFAEAHAKLTCWAKECQHSSD